MKGLALIGLLVAGVAGAQSAYPQFGATAGAGFTVGTADEIVYADSSTQTKLSELLWPIPLSPTVWTAVTAQWAPQFLTSLRFQTVVPLGTGDMTDNDWNTPGNNDLYDSDGDLLSTIHSDSTAYLTADWDFRLEATVPFRAPGVQWRLGVGLDYHHLAWEAWNTTQTETLASNGATSTVSLTGLSIIFRQDWVLFYLGAGVSVPWFGADWGLDLRVSPFPWDTQADSHILRQLMFNESVTGGFMVEPELTVTWPVAPAISVTANVQYQGTFFLRGDEVVSVDGAGSGSNSAGFYSYSGTAGAGLQSWTFGLAVNVGLGPAGEALR